MGVSKNDSAWSKAVLSLLGAYFKAYFDWKIYKNEHTNINGNEHVNEHTNINGIEHVNKNKNESVNENVNENGHINENEH